MTPEEERRRWSEQSPYWIMVSDASRNDERHYSESAARTAPVISAELEHMLPARGRALELASGTGQHMVDFASRHPGIEWLPSDPHPAARTSAAAWVAEAVLDNVREPLDIDVTDVAWERELLPGLDAIVVVNLLHIAPWSATEGVIRGAGALLAPRGQLILYGCFRREGTHLSYANGEFDRSLRYRDARWGVRDTSDIKAAAGRHDLCLAELIDMPSNNLLLIVRRG